MNSEKRASTSTLLLPTLEAVRQDTPVAVFPVKGDPRRAPEGTPRYKDSKERYGELEAVRRSMLNPHDIHAECGGPGGWHWFVR